MLEFWIWWEATQYKTGVVSKVAPPVVAGQQITEIAFPSLLSLQQFAGLATLANSLFTFEPASGAADQREKIVYHVTIG